MNETEFLQYLDGAYAKSSLAKGQPNVSKPTKQKLDPVEVEQAITNAANKAGINPEYLKALAKQETRMGEAAIGTNNVFNIKGVGNSAYDKVEGSTSSYKNYGSLQEAADDAARLIATKYPNAAKAQSAQEFGKGLKGYATDPQHGNKIANIITKGESTKSETDFLKSLDDAYNKSSLNKQPVENKPVEEPKDESFWGKAKEVFLAGPFGMTKEINKASPEARTMINESTKSLTAGFYDPKLATKEETEANPKSKLAGAVLGTVPITMIPGGLTARTAIGATHGGLTSANEAESGDKLKSGLTGAALGGAASLVGEGVANVVGAAYKYGRKLFSEAIDKYAPTILSKATNYIKENPVATRDEIRAQMLKDNPIPSREKIRDDMYNANPEIFKQSTNDEIENLITQSQKDATSKLEEAITQAQKEAKPNIYKAVREANPSDRGSMFNKNTLRDSSELGKDIVSKALNDTVSSMSSSPLGMALVGAGGGGLYASVTDSDPMKAIAIGAGGGAAMNALKVNLLKHISNGVIDKFPAYFSKIKPENVGNKADFVLSRVKLAEADWSKKYQVAMPQAKIDEIEKVAKKYYDDYHAALNEFYKMQSKYNLAGQTSGTATKAALMGGAEYSSTQPKKERNQINLMGE